MTFAQIQFKKRLVGLGIILGFIIFAVFSFQVVKVIAQPTQEIVNPETVVQEAAVEGSGITDPNIIKWGFMAAAIAVGVGSLGAGVAVGYIGSAAMGTIGEKPELAGRALIFVGLAEGIAIYGLIIAIMILGKI